MHAALLALLVIPAYLLFKLALHIVKGINNARRARQLGCQQPPWWPGLDPLGVGPLIQLSKETKTGTELAYFAGVFDKASALNGRHVHTLEGQFLRVPMLITRDPKNVQALLATQFKDFELGVVRHGTFGPL